MKINGVSGVKPPRKVEQPTQEPKREGEPTDRVSTQQQQRLDEVRRAAQQAGDQQHEARLRELEQQIKLGTYKPDPRRIAEEILQAAQLQAQVAAMLH